MAAKVNQDYGHESSFQGSLDDRYQQLTKHPSGSVKELGSIVWPLVLSLLSTSLMGFCNRLFLSHYSIEALEASVSAMNLALLFQIPCMRITSIAQVLVARLSGAQQFNKIGSVIWQMIWFSLITMVATVPLGLVTGHFFFRNTVIEAAGSLYFASLMFGNFLFPLGAALASFFTGIGNTRMIIAMTLMAHVLHVTLDYFLIFGIPGFLDPQGAFGAAVATIVAEGFYCLLLFVLFLRKREQKFYGTSAWPLQFSVLKEGIVLGLPRAISKLLILAAWAASVAILTYKGGDYLLSFSLGASIFTLFSCFNEGIGQGLMTVVSFYLTAEKKQSLFTILRSAVILLIGGLALLAGFLIIFPDLIVKTFFANQLSTDQAQILLASCYGLWFFFLSEGVSWIGYSILNAYKDTKFIMIYTTCTVFVFNYLPLYLAFHVGNWPAERIWWLMGIPCLASALAYIFRIRHKFSGFEKFMERSL